MIQPGSANYDEWNDRGFNLRFKGNPKSIVPVSSIAELSAALQQAVDDGVRLAVRGGGHGLENFVSHPSIERIIDISQMKGIRHDPEKRAIEVLAGETVGEMHTKLFQEWRTVVPVGEHPDIGMGGHIAGGAFGFLCRKFGLGVDHLYAVEVLWVNKNRKVETVVASREPDDKNRDLWWAHTGGGTGNFGVVTRYWFRSPDAVGDHPSDLLPRAPEEVETIEIDWDWNAMNKNTFFELVKRFGRWIGENSGDGIIARELFVTMILTNQTTGKIHLQGLVTETKYSEFILEAMIRSIHPHPELKYNLVRKKMSWIEFAMRPFWGNAPANKIAFKFKDAFLLKPFSEEQIRTIYRYLTERPDTPGAAIGMASYGGKVNTVSGDETATAQRNAILTTSGTPGWKDPAEAEKYMDWARSCYRDLYVESGGAPVPGERAGGCIIAHPDNDLADPEWNRTGVPWPVFYYQQHYPRLQKIKAKWDPLTIFHHALSVEPAFGIP